MEAAAGTIFRKPGEAAGSVLASVHQSLPSPSLRPAPTRRSRLRVDDSPAESAAAMAAEDLDWRLPAGRSRSTTTVRRLPHNRAARSAGQRVMRHFMHENAIFRRPPPLAFAIAPLTLRMRVAAASAVLVAAPGEAQGLPARRLATVPGAVDIAAVAASAENDLSTAEGAVEPAGSVTHRGSRPGRGGPARSRPGGPLRENAPMPGGGNGATESGLAGAFLVPGRSYRRRRIGIRSWLRVPLLQMRVRAGTADACSTRWK